MKNGQRHGQGKMTWSDGGYYEGEFLNGNRHGKGKHVFANGFIYDGGWKNGLMHGNGVNYYSNGVKEEVTCDNGNCIKRKIIK